MEQLAGLHMGVSKNRGKIPKWMVYIVENPIFEWMIWGENPTIFGNIMKHPYQHSECCRIRTVTFLKALRCPIEVFRFGGGFLHT